VRKTAVPRKEDREVGLGGDCHCGEGIWDGSYLKSKGKIKVKTTVTSALPPRVHLLKSERLFVIGAKTHLQAVEISADAKNTDSGKVQVVIQIESKQRNGPSHQAQKPLNETENRRGKRSVGRLSSPTER